MKNSIKTGVAFGLTSGVITTLGLMVGLHSGTHSKLVVMGGILTIAIADAFSDALGIHISEEAENVHSAGQIWASTVATFLSKLFFALTFLIPVFLFSLSTAVVVSLAWGLCILALLSFYLAQAQGERPWKVMGEHLFITLIVIIATHFAGDWITRVIH